MKKINIIVVFICVATLVLSGCFGKDVKESEVHSSENQKSEVTTEVSKDKSKGITVKMPEGWTKVEDSSIPIHYQNVTRSFMVKEEPFKAENLDDVVKEALEIYKASFAGFKVTEEPAKYELGGLDARRLSFVCEINNTDMKYMYVYTFIDGKCYTLVIGDLANSFDQFTKEYEQILKGVEVSEK